MKRINITFTDFWEGFNYFDNFIVRALSNKYEVNIVEYTKDRVLDVDILFYSCFGMNHLFTDCVKVFYTGENIVPNFNECDYAIGFDYIDFGDRYIRYPLYNACYREDVSKMMNKKPVTKNKFCATVVSNNVAADPFREIFFHELSKYKQVDSGGKWLNNIGISNGVDDKIGFQSDYKFVLAFENSSSPGYVTEKIVQAYASNAIPIYWGDPFIFNTFNPNSFICVTEANFEDAIQRIIECDTDDYLYDSIMKEPAIVDECQHIEQYDLRLEKWLCSILDKEYEKRKKYNRYGKNKLLIEERKEKEIFFSKYANESGAMSYKKIGQNIINKYTRIMNIK